jgi:hypothetical protein
MYVPCAEMGMAYFTPLYLGGFQKADAHEFVKQQLVPSTDPVLSAPTVEEWKEIDAVSKRA